MRQLGILATMIATSFLVLAGCGDDDVTPPVDSGMSDGGGGVDGGGMDGGGMDGGGMDGGGMDGGDVDSGVCTPTGDERTWLACTDGVDNDCDGETDTDPGCSICPPAGAPESGAESSEALCADGVDNDCDGVADCADSGCRAIGTCTMTEDTDALCSDGLDNDGNGRIDCAQRSCAATMTCRPATMVADENDATLCGNGLDDDYDGRSDCDDMSCMDIGFCGTEGDDTTCADTNDNDGDGFVDCVDSGCSAVAACMGEADDTACTNGTDDDGDGRIDCRDADCLALDVCRDIEMVCDDTMDNDADGHADCTDSDCEASCMSMACSDTNWFGTCTDAMDVCAMGVCARPLSSFTIPTDETLLITEIMANPNGLDDAVGEYAEVTNVSAVAIDVFGLVFSDNDPTHIVTVDEHRPLMPGDTLVFVASTDPALNGGIMNGIGLTFGLNNTGDDAAILFGTTDIHRVTYQTPSTDDLSHISTDVSAARSYNLDAGFVAGTSTTATWCITPDDAANEYEATGPNYGTPGAANVSCL